MVKTIRIKNKTSNNQIKIGRGSFYKLFNDLKRLKSKKYIQIDSKIYKKIKPNFDKIKDFVINNKINYRV